MNEICAARTGFATVLLIGLLVAPAWAGGGDIDGLPDDPADGPSFFGEAKDIGAFKPLEGVSVRAEFGKGQAILTSTDPDGRFHFGGFGHDVSPDTIQIKCSMRGYKLVDVPRRRASNAPESPVELECLMEKE